MNQRAIASGTLRFHGGERQGLEFRVRSAIQRRKDVHSFLVNFLKSRSGNPGRDCKDSKPKPLSSQIKARPGLMLLNLLWLHAKAVAAARFFLFRNGHGISDAMHTVKEQYL